MLGLKSKLEIFLNEQNRLSGFFFFFILAKTLHCSEIGAQAGT